MKIILVKWRDTHGNSDIIREHEITGPAIVLSCGWLIFEKSTHIAIAGEKHEDGTWRDMAVIPKENIISRKTITPKWKEL